MSMCFIAIVDLGQIVDPSAPLMKTSHQVIAFGLLAVLFALGYWYIVRPVLWKPAEPAPGKTPMPRRRILTAYAVIALIVGGSLIDAIRDSEHWPWSCYPMYSYMETGTKFEDYRLYGVLKSDPNVEISLYTDERFTQPFDQSRLAVVFEQVIKSPRLDNGLINCLTRYEALRRAGRHSGPELSKLRLYHVYWTLDPMGATIEKPDRKVLVKEVSLPDADVKSS